jgi:glycosyltransferase involved in cell wall biosynthesis
MSLVSVIIPVFNAARYLEESVASIVRQADAAPLEVILVDDGSTDESGALADALARRYPALIRAFHRPNGGISAARNAGLAQARSEFIALQDADDVSVTGRLAAQVRLLQATAKAAVAFGRIEHFISPDVPPQDHARYQPLPPTQQGTLAGSLMTRRAVFDRVGGFNENYRRGEMLDWLLRAREHDIDIVHVDAVILRRRIHMSNSMLAPNASRQLLHVIKASLDRQRAAALKPDSDST